MTISIFGLFQIFRSRHFEGKGALRLATIVCVPIQRTDGAPPTYLLGSTLRGTETSHLARSTVSESQRRLTT